MGTNLELFMEALNVILDPLDELCLVLPNGTTDMGTHKQGVEAREDAEHLVGILGRTQLVSEASCDAGLCRRKERVVKTWYTAISNGSKNTRRGDGTLVIFILLCG